MKRAIQQFELLLEVIRKVKRIPFFSVIIPVYNVSDYLEQCLDSVLQQSFQDYEIILVEDCSTDDSAALCHSYLQRDSRLRLVQHEANRGLSAARNSGMRLAQGSWWVFLDSDDYWSGEILQEVYDTVVGHPDCTVVRGRAQYYDMSLQRISGESSSFSPEYASGLDFLQDMLHSHRTEVTVWLYFFSAALLQSGTLYFREGIIAEDIPWTPELLYQSGKLFCLPSAYYLYRIKRAGSIMHSAQQAERLSASLAIILSEVADSRLQQPLLREYYLRIFNSWLYHTSKLTYEQRADAYNSLPSFKRLYAVGSGGRLLRCFAALWGERGYGYPYAIAYGCWIALRRYIYAALNWIRKAL